MKMLRELWLSQHRGVETRLDRMWTETLAPALKPEDHVVGRAKAGPGASWRTAVRNLWREALWPYRRAWAGLAVIWLALLVVTFGHEKSEEVGGPRPVAFSRQVLDTLEQQWRQAAELAESREPTSAQAPSSVIPKPRSQGASRVRLV